MRRNKFLIMTFSVLVILSAVTPVSALYFEYHYFETDKLVYEIGETINMLAEVIADFSPSGWSYVSFEVVTDLGPKFADGYFISSSLNVRSLGSSYFLRSQDSSPGINGTLGYVIFNIEVYDGYSEGDGETIEIQIVRGHLEVTPLTILTLESGTNATFQFRISSPHTNSTVYANQTVSLQVNDSGEQTQFEQNVTTDSEGIISYEWNSSFNQVGLYNLTFAGYGDELFLPFTQSFTVNVHPAPSNLTVLSSPATVYSETPTGTHFQSAEIVVQHSDIAQIPIDDSLVQWRTSFAEGNATFLQNGTYLFTIPFTVGPGLQVVNVSALNPAYQVANRSVDILVLQRNVSISFFMSSLPVSGEYVHIEIQTNDTLNAQPINMTHLSISIIANSSLFLETQGTTNETGHYHLSFLISIDTWGPWEIQVYFNGTTFYNSQSETYKLNISFTPHIDYETIAPIILGQHTEVVFRILNPKDNSISGITIDIQDHFGDIICSNQSNSIGLVLLSWFPNDTLKAGIHNYSLKIQRNNTAYIIDSMIPIILNFCYPLSVVPVNHPWNVTRGNNITLGFIIQSSYIQNTTIEIELIEKPEQVSSSFNIMTGELVEFLYLTDENDSLGFQFIEIKILNSTFNLIDLFELEILVLGMMNITLDFGTAFYSSNLEVNCTALDDHNETISAISLHAFSQGNNTPFATIENMNTSTTASFSVPQWITPGRHQITFLVSSLWHNPVTRNVEIHIWIKTSISLVITRRDSRSNSSFHSQSANHTLNILSEISCGSIIKPPPILFSDTTSISVPTTRIISLDNCPRLSSGTNNFSTVLENSRISLSGNGHKVLSFSALVLATLDSAIITSSTDLDVEPKEMTPHSAWAGPDTTTSVNRFDFFETFAVILRTKSS